MYKGETLTTGISSPRTLFIVNYFRLRPELMWFLISFMVMFTAIATVRWTIKPDINEGGFLDTPFEMIELKIQEPEEVEPELLLPEEAAEEILEENKQLKFGDDSGQFDPALGKPPIPMFTSYPPYPPAMKKAGVEGQVIVELGIDETGRIVYGKIVKSLHPVLDKIVIKWIQKQKFSPAQNAGGEAFRCRLFLPVRFELH